MAAEMEAGRRVTEHVELVREIGSGAMGTVWEAKNLALDTPVAVKFLSPDIVGADASVFERFKREAAVAARIRSPHAVQIFDFGRLEDQQPYIVMELLSGESLADRIARGPLTLEQVATVVSQTTEVLGRAHRLGVVHRDIKPDNLFLIDSGYDVFVKVLDFGVAKDLTGEGRSMTQTGALVGTPYYMSPELVTSAKGATAQADLWALAVVAYEALTGAMPFDSETLGGVLVKIASFDFAPASARAPHLPAEVDAWFARAFHRDLDVRFPSAEEMAAELAAAIGLPAKRSQPSLPAWDSRPSLEALRPSPGVASRPQRLGTLAATEMGRPVAAPPPKRSTPARVIAAAIATAVLVIGTSAFLLRADPAPAAPSEPLLSPPDAPSPSPSPSASLALATSPAPSPSSSPSLAPSLAVSSSPSSSPPLAPLPSAAATSPSRPAPRAPTPDRPNTAKPSAKPDGCMAYDAKRKKWVYTCN